jgi:uncharacterized protein YjiS (DUF1127 family)
MRDYVLSRVMALEEAGGRSISCFLRHWMARCGARKLEECDDYLLADIGVTREDLRWAAGLPLTVNAANPLE